MYYSYTLLLLTYYQGKVYLSSNRGHALSGVLIAIIAKSSVSHANQTSPLYPNITPSGGRSLGRTAAINYPLYGTKIGNRIPHSTTPGMTTANGSTIAGANASICFFVVQDTMNVRF